MSGEEQQVNPSEESTPSVLGARYSLKEMMDEVQRERRESHFGRELVDVTEIDKMFSKRVRKKKKS